MRIGQLRLNVSMTVGEQESRSTRAVPAAPDLPPGVLADIARGLSGGTPLPPDVLAWARSTYGADLSQTRIYDGPEARRLNDAAGTEGLTIGERQILLRQPGDQETLLHEVTHAAQAARGDRRAVADREREAVRAEQVLARRPSSGPAALGDIDLQRLADRVYDLLADQLRRERERRL